MIFRKTVLPGLALASLVVGSTVAADDPLKNPYTGNEQAIAEGHQLFLDTGCYSCHGHGAEGGMGPNLTGAGNRCLRLCGLSGGPPHCGRGRICAWADLPGFGACL